MTIRRDSIHRGVSFDEADERVNPPPAVTDFDRVVATALSRRGFLGGTISLGLGAFLTGTSARAVMAQSSDRFGFQNLPANTEDTITVPEGYSWKSVAHWGDPLFPDAPAFDESTLGTAASQERTFGDCTDGMELFTRDGRQVIAVNHEYINEAKFWSNRPDGLPADEDDIRKSIAAHGVAVFEVSAEGAVVLDSAFNRRITAATPMALTGPAAGSPLVQTAADAAGTTPLGTMNNCGSGRTPWGTYLTCEENFNGYFGSSAASFEPTPEQKRYGLGNESRYGWEKVDPRFDMAQAPNEPNRHGYIVEIDPFDPASVPKKRSALGRFKHENADVVLSADDRVVVYMGDDERGEFLYRFVSAAPYVEGGDTSALLDEGTLYVAKFNDDLTGAWLPLTPESTGMAADAIALFTRMAGSAVGATTMDRPEWVASHPERAETYLALTNNSNRGTGKTNAGGDAMELDAANPREKNVYGQIVRWLPDGGDPAADTFTWSLFALAGNPAVHQGPMAGSANITADNMFNSPDGMMFDSRGLLWIQTDGNYSNDGDFLGQGHNQMLAADPETGEIRRFLVGPNECEVTGLCWSADKRIMYVGIQHPGEEGNSHFPGGGNSIPRSGIIAVTRADGGPLG